MDKFHHLVELALPCRSTRGGNFEVVHLLYVLWIGLLLTMTLAISLTAGFQHIPNIPPRYLTRLSLPRLMVKIRPRPPCRQPHRLLALLGRTFPVFIT